MLAVLFLIYSNVRVPISSKGCGLHRSVVYHAESCDTMVARKTVPHGPSTFWGCFYYVVTDLFRPAFNSIPDDGLVKITPRHTFGTYSSKPRQKVINRNEPKARSEWRYLSRFHIHHHHNDTAIKYTITNFSYKKMWRPAGNTFMIVFTSRFTVEC